MSDIITKLPIGQLQPNPFQPREKVKNEEIQDLVDSIKIHGILEPLVVAQTPAGFQIIAGERRWRAAHIAELTEVPVIVRRTTPKGMLEMALVENVQRIDLSPLERAQAFLQLQRVFGYNPTKIAKNIGKSPSYVLNTLKLIELPDAIKDGLVSGSITEGHARALQSIKDEKLMIEAYKIILKEGASVRRAEDLARRFREAKKVDRAPKAQKFQVSDKQLKKWQDQMTGTFHAKSALKLVRTAKQTRLSIIFKGSPEQTETDLDKIIEFVTGKEEED